MNLIDRTAELKQALNLKVKIAESEAQLTEWDGKEGQIKDDLAEAREQLEPLLQEARPRDGRVGILLERIGKLENELYFATRTPRTIENTLRKLGSDFGGYRSRDYIWLKDWRIGRQPDVGPAIDVDDEGQCAKWMLQVKVHAEVFLSDAAGDQYIADAELKLSRRRAELAAGRQRNAEVDAEVARLRAEIAEERKRRAEENHAKLEAFDRERAEFRAKLDREMAEAKTQASLAFDRRVAKKEVRRHTWLTKYWTKIAKARDDKAFRDEWLAKASARNPKRAVDLRKVFRSAGDAASALRGAEQFDLIRQKWDRVVELLDADPTLTSDEAEAVADPEYREQRADLREQDEARLAAHNQAQIDQAKAQIAG